MIGKNFKYKLVKNFLTQEEINLAKKYFTMKQRVKLY
jgi:hypothetical protein